MNARFEQLGCLALAALFCFATSHAASALPAQPGAHAAPGYVVDVRKGRGGRGFRAVPGRRFDGGRRFGGGRKFGRGQRFNRSPRMRGHNFKHRRYHRRGPGFRKIPRRRYGGPFVPYYYLPIDPYVNDYSYGYYDGASVHPCRWLLRNARRTGKRYWWNRYKRCVAEYD